MAAEESLSDDQFHPINIAAEATRRDLPNRYNEKIGRHLGTEASDFQLEGVRPIEAGNPDPDHTHVATYSFKSSIAKRRQHVEVGLSADERKSRSLIWRS